MFKHRLRVRVWMLITIGCLFFSCSEEETSLTDSFFKIYDNSDFDLGYDPIDVIEVSNGYIILSGTERSDTDFDGILMIKIDEEGNYLFSEEAAFSDFEAPVGDMYFDDSDSSIYFFAKTGGNIDAVLISINTSLAIQNTTILRGLNYPLSASATSGNTLLLQSYDPVGLETQISEISLEGGFQGGAVYSIGAGDDVEEEIIDHFLEATNHPLPFFCGEVSPENYYFNGFYNFSLSLVFTDFGRNPNGVVQGQSTNAGIRSAMALGGSDFALSGFQFDDNYQLSSTTLSMGGITSSADLYPGNMAELKPYTATKIFNYATSGNTYTVFTSETKGNQIVLHFYNTTTGGIDGVHYIGYLNPYAFSSVKVTEDESILILGTTFVARRFERITLNKISKSEIEDILN
ncbi:MAG: hypothetical protein AAGC64_04000 [Bacteroidota bacterium]